MTGLLKIKKVLLFFLCFFYIYTVSFVFIPWGIHTRMLMGIAGIFLYFGVKFDSFCFFKWRVDRLIFLLISLSFCVSSFSLASIIYNRTYDYVYVTFPISVILVLFAAYFVLFVFHKVWKVVSFEIIANYVVVVVIFQMIISFLFFLFPEVKVLFDSIITLDSLQEEALQLSDGMRLHGFGINFFEGGVVNSCTLILLAALIKKEKRKKKMFFYFDYREYDVKNNFDWGAYSFGIVGL